MENQRKIRILNDEGKIEEICISDISSVFPVIQTDIPDELLAKIRAIFEPIKDLIGMSLEEFEVGFMRGQNIENEILHWECIVNTFAILSPFFKNDEKRLLDTVIYISVNALYEDEKENELIKCIMESYENISKLTRR